MPLPDFLGIGAPRSGTRWLAECLAEHPEISLPDGEVYFFTTRRVVWPYWYRGLEWYSGLLEQVRQPGARLVGEITPVYLFDDDTPGKIYSVVPDVKLICCVREQVDRAFSWYRLFLHHNPLLTPKAYPFSKFLTYSPEVYGREGFYLEHLARYRQYFSDDQMLTFAYDDLKLGPAELVTRVYRFLGVDDSFVPSAVSERINPMPLQSGDRRGESSKQWKRAVRKVTGPVKSLLSQFREDPMVEAERRGYLLTNEIRAQMYELFREHNQELGRVIGRDLSHWNKPKQ